MAAPARPDAAAIAAARAALAGRIVATPTLSLPHDALRAALPEGAGAVLKLELFQHAGSFKSRGVLLALDALGPAARAAGVVAVSAGNHALAVAWAAQAQGVAARVFMPAAADPVRIEGCRALGAEVTLAENVGAAFRQMAEVAEAEGRTVLHPFESPFMVLGAATVGAELAEAAPDLEVAVVPVGGGGLIAGMALGLRAALPGVRIFGVEPEGADAMSRSLAAGAPVALDRVNTIADSLGAPMALPMTFAIVRDLVEGIVRLPDAAFPPAMRLMNRALKLMPEPACAAALAAATGPLAGVCRGRRVGLIACGANLSPQRFCDLVA